MKSDYSMNANQKHRIRVLNSFCLEYTEDDHVMHISADLREDAPCAVRIGRNGWDYPYDTEILDELKAHLIKHNILEYLQHEGFGNVHTKD